MKFLGAIVLLGLIATGGFFFGYYSPFKEKMDVSKNYDLQPKKEAIEEFREHTFPTLFVSKLSSSEFTSSAEDLRNIVLNQNPHEAFEKLRFLIDEKKVRKDCNNLTYQIGLAIYEKYPDLNTAVEATERLCGYGAFHGVLGAHFAKQSDPYVEMQSLCRSFSQKRQEMECYHAVGHSMMELTKGDRERSKTACREFLSDNAQSVCAIGIFHEYFQPHEEYHKVVFSSPQNIFSPCEQEEGIYRSACYKLAPRAYITAYPEQRKDIMPWCVTTSSAEDRSSCVRGAIADIMQYVYDFKQLEMVCLTGSSQDIEPCIFEIVYNKLQYTEKTDMKKTCKEQFVYPGIQDMCLKAVDIESRT